jgi:hypothetical protein
MATINTLKFKSGTRAQLNTAASSNVLNVGEPYYITDENRIAIGTSSSTYQDFLKPTDNVQAHPSWDVRTGAYTAVAGDELLVDTTSAAFTVTLPATPAANTTVTIVDNGGALDTNALTIARNGRNIMGLAEDMTVATNYASVKLTYIDVTRGWVLV